MLQRVYVPMSVSVNHMLDADILDYQPRGLLRGDVCGAMISGVSRGGGCHTGLFHRDGNQAVALGMRLGRQKLKRLEDEVEANPRLIDVYRYVGWSQWNGKMPYEAQGLPDDVRSRIVDTVKDFALRDRYGWWEVARSSVYFVPILRELAVPHHAEIESGNARPHCSQSVSHAFRKEGHRLFNRLPDRLVLPGDFSICRLLLYLFTLDVPTASVMPIEEYYRGVRITA